MQGVLLRSDESLIETILFQVGSWQTGFVLRPDEFERAFWQGPGQLTIHAGQCAITVLVHGELGEALGR